MDIAYLFVLANITWTDLKERLIPDEWVLTALLFRFLTGHRLSPTWLIACFFFVLLTLFGLGWGDVKLAMVLYMSGGSFFYRIAFSFLLAALVSFFLLLFTETTKESHLPMAPFLIIVELFFL